MTSLINCTHCGPSQWVAGAGCLATEITWPRTVFGGRIKSLVYAVKSSTGAEMLNRITDAYAHIKNDQTSLLKSVTSISRRDTAFTGYYGAHFEQLLFTTNINTFFIKMPLLIINLCTLNLIKCKFLVQLSRQQLLNCPHPTKYSLSATHLLFRLELTTPPPPKKKDVLELRASYCMTLCTII
jgi:hypothetical protein